MKASELRALPEQELLREYDDRMKELFNLRYQANTEQLENPALIRRTRRDVARIKTILNERQMEKSK